MTADVPPPLSPPRATPRVRPDVPVLASLLVVFVGAGMLASICAGGAALSFAHRSEQGLARSAARREARAQERARLDDAKSSLDAVAARLEASARESSELPESLGEAPPKDPWGRPIEYCRPAPDRAMLRSAGPDGKFGTKDDVRREVELR
jgi:hypothetical protein